MEIVRKNAHFDELTHTLLREFVDKIIVHECSYNENGTRRQEIEIYYSFGHSRKFCVSEFRQSQELWTTEGTDRLTFLVCRTPGGRRGMRTLGVNAAAASREQ